MAGSRLLARTLIERPLPGQVVARGKEAIIVGAGDAAQLVIKEMLRNPSLGYTPIAIVDDDPRKRNLRLHGIRVVGTTADLPQVIRDRRPDEVLIAMPSASGEVRGRIVGAAQGAGLTVKTLPGLTELVSGDSGLTTQLRPVQVEDVLGREPVEVDLDSIAGYVSAEVVMVTGAGGSIGSELCRQLSRLGPARLVLVDHSEPALFEVDRELARERGFLAGVPIVADVKDGVKMRQVFAKYRPGVVFHAAAYKHVAMMEANPIEAVRNNTLGTRTLADVAVEFGAKRFVLVSTDKAANPRTIMGQSKALCEWIVETWGHRGDVSTRFVAVRFGNVLGSSGLGDPDLPPSDREGRAGDGDAPGDDTVLHDDPRGRAARRPGGRDRRAWPGLRARHGRARADHGPGREHDPALRQGAGDRDPDRGDRAGAGREAARGARRRR